MILEYFLSQIFSVHSHFQEYGPWFQPTSIGTKMGIESLGTKAWKSLHD